MPIADLINKETQSWVALSRWLQTPVGQRIAAAEQAALSDILPDLFGYHLVQLGDYGATDLALASRISHKAILKIGYAGGVSAGSCAAVINSGALPLAAASVDLVILPHVLEFAHDTHALLRETERILIGDGHVVIVMFNPLSFWGVGHLLVAWRDRVPFNGRSFLLARVSDWLSLLGFDIVQTRRIYFRPLFRSAKIAEQLLFMEKLGAAFLPLLGSVNIIVGRKRIIPLTPVKIQWKAKRRLIASGLAEPTTRVTRD